MSNFEDKLKKTISEIAKTVKFTYIVELNSSIIVKMFITSVEFKDNGFIMDWFTNEKLTSDEELECENLLGKEILRKMESMSD